MATSWGGRPDPKANLLARVIFAALITVALLWLAETSAERVDDGICTEVDGDCNRGD